MTKPATPPASEPNAYKPAKIGISGNIPPVLGIGMILDVWFFLTFLYEVFLAATRHF
jgi:hypothetical protein